jgi:hypothetical protein
MDARRRIALLIAFAWALASPAAARAGSASFSIAGGAVGGDSGATSSGGVTFLPATGAPRVGLNFVLPRDYATDTPISIVLYLHAAETSCGFVLVTDSVAHRRPGVPSDFTTSVFAPKNGSPVVAAPADLTIVAQKTYVLSPGGTLAHMKRGDEFFIRLVRDPSDPSDTCTNSLALDAVDVRYTTP